MISAYGLDLAHGVIEKAASLDLSIPVWKDGKVIFKKVTVKANTAYELTINGGSALNGAMGMRMMLKSQIIIRRII